MKRQITISLVTLSLIALLLGGLSFTSNGRDRRTGLVPAARAQAVAERSQLDRTIIRRCSIGTVNGSYAYSASGTIIQPIPQLQIPAGPFVVTSLLTLSGGSFTFKGTQSFNGAIVPAMGTGTYTVNDDCTGAAVDSVGTPYSFVVADNGDEIRIMLGIPGTAISGVAKRL
jgi:hypothetical protein